MNNDCTHIQYRRMAKTEREISASLEATAYELGRLRCMTETHPWARGWAIRSSVDSVLSWYHNDGEMPDRGGVLASLAGLPSRAVKDIGLSNEATGWVVLASRHGDPVLVRDEQRRDLDAARKWLRYSRGRTALDSSICGLRRAAEIFPIGPAARIAFCERLAAENLLPLPFPALGPAKLGIDGLVDEDVLRDEVCASLRASVRGFDVWCRQLSRLHEQLGPRRSTSRLGPALDALAGEFSVSPALLARTLGVTVRGAALLLDELVSLGAAIEVTDREASRVYALRDPDGADVKAEYGAWRETSRRARKVQADRDRRRVRPALPSKTRELVELQEIEDELDAAMAGLDAVEVD